MPPCPQLVDRFYRTLFRLLQRFLPALCLAWTLTACAPRETPAEAGARSGILHLSLGPEPGRLDPHLATSLADVRAVSALFEGLVGQDPATLDPLPAAALRWESSADGVTHTFHLRPNGRWSDGKPVTADDFVASVRRVLTPALAAPNAPLLHTVLNAEAWHRGRLTDFTSVGIRAIDAHTLRIQLERPDPAFFSKLSHPAWFPVPVHAILASGPEDGRENRWDAAPATLVGNGPFVLKEWRTGRTLRFAASTTHRDGTSLRLREVMVHVFDGPDAEERAYRAGQLHVTDSLPAGRVDVWRTEAPGQLRTEPVLDVYFYRINTTRPHLSDPRVRRALSLAIDRPALVAALLRGGQTPARAFVPPFTNGYSPPEVLRHDPAAARALLAEAGYPDGAGLPTLELLYNTSENHRRIAEVVQQQWRAIGVQSRLTNQEFASLLEARRAGDFQILRSSWVADYNEPLSFLDLFTSTNPNNYTGWSDPAYDHALSQAALTQDPQARHELYRSAETRLLDAAPLLPVYVNAHVYLIHPAVRGWFAHPLARHPLERVWLEP